MGDLEVVKRDDRKEAWSIDKLVTSIGKAGVPLENAETISKEVEEWARQKAEKGDVTSDEIRDKVIEVLSKDFKTQADSYQAYKK